MGKWHYICLLTNLFNREIVGYSAGAKKDADLGYQAFLTSKINLSKIKIFHTDRSNEFKNKIIDEVLEAFNIKCSLSKKTIHMIELVLEISTRLEERNKKVKLLK